MGQVVPTQHPAVVLRSHYNHLRALLAVAMFAVAGLTAVVVILATNDQTDTSGRSVSSQETLTPQEKRWSAYDEAIRALTPEQRAAAFGARSADVAPSQPRPTEDQTFPGLARQARPAEEAVRGGAREGGPEEGTRGPTPLGGPRP